MSIKLKSLFRHMFIELADPRMNDLPLVKSPLPILCILFAYAFFVLKLGPKLMENRKPFELKRVLVVYNALQVIFNAVLMYPSLRYCYVFGNYSLLCEPLDRSRSPVAMRVAFATYCFFLTKVFDLLDTVFFVLRKKNNQVSFLHVYHHFAMPLICWGVVKYFPGGHLVLGGLLNCTIHVVMYTYYMISAMGPQYQKYLWWKKYITKFQLAQFIIAGLMAVGALVYDCGIPKWMVFFGVPNFIVFFVLFSDFYKSAYIKGQKAKSLLDRTNDENNNVVKSKVQ